MDANSVGTWLGVALGAASLAVSVGGFWIAIRQIQKTAGAAEASAISAAMALATVRELHLRDSLSKLVSLSREIEANSSIASQRRLLSDWLDAADTALAYEHRGAEADFSSRLSRCRERMRDAKIQLWTPVSAKKSELRSAILDVTDEGRRLAIERLSSALHSEGRTRS